MKPFRILHFSDPHIVAPLESWRCFFDKRVIGFINCKMRRNRSFDRAMLSEIAKRILKERPDLAVFTGDAATCSQPSEFDAAYEALKIVPQANIPLIYTPGNHDLYVHSDKCRKALNEFIKKLTCGILSLDKYPYAADFGPLRFIALNGALPTSIVMSSGRLDSKSNDLIKNECAKKSKPLVAVSHFPVLKDADALFAFRRKLFNSAMLAQCLQNKSVDLLLCGHIHKAYGILDESGRGETSSGSVTRYACFNKIEYFNNVFKIENLSLKH